MVWSRIYIVTGRWIMEKEITIKEFAKELKERLTAGKTVDCCKDELLRLADMASEKMGSEKILVQWKE
jgi:translation initiation factor 1 (eIF-1/SUI1)